jgi:1-acyl-sn-glycerol-3-phosphate acyltransferase
LIYILRLFIRGALWLFCIDIKIINKHLLNNKKPVLIIANHPNSFLDAIIIGSQYKKPINFLARGDVFNKKHHRFLLGLLKMIPIYRLRDGKQNLHLNEFAFNETVRLIKKGESVLIFIEGTCINDHTLQPFKKGAARIIEKLNEQKVYYQIHIVGIAYNQLRGIGKEINLCINEFKFDSSIISSQDKIIFNKQVYNILSTSIYKSKQQTNIKKTPLYFLHYFYYHLMKKITTKVTRGTVFFDSVLFSLLLFTYPLFLLLIFYLLQLFGIPNTIIFVILLCIPVLSKHAIKF